MANDPEIIEIAPSPSHRPSRREIVRRLLAGIGAGAAWPLISAAHPIHRHLANGSLLEQADAKLAAANWSPVFLDHQQNETLIFLSEAIVPGSKSALVNRFIDLLLSVDTYENQKEFAASLAAVDAEAQHRFGHPFHALPTAQQNALLTLASGGDPSQESSPTLRDHFENLKGWISGAYYSSEPGMTELGWTGNPFFERFPGCQHPDGHS
jgi:hypothetical protein